MESDAHIRLRKRLKIYGKTTNISASSSHLGKWYFNFNGPQAAVFGLNDLKSLKFYTTSRVVSM